MKLVLENSEGKAVRTFDVQGEKGVVINRRDTRRLEIHPNLEFLHEKKVKFDKLGEISKTDLEKNPYQVAKVGQLRLVTAKVEEVIIDPILGKENSRNWYRSLAALIVLFVSFFSFLYSRPTHTAKMEENLKQQVVQIVKKIPPPQPKEEVRAVAKDNKVDTQVVQPKKTGQVKRMGALSVLGSLNSGKQRGGLDLGAVNTTAGPGLGGTQGSGGVQTTLYGKGLVAAPLGAGSNMQGGGGYGTKGKGGGQAGYGKLSLIGSAGSAPIPLGREAIIDGGLDRDLIADVINRNMGQIRFCYEQGLQGDPALAGRVAINFTIGGNGTVKLAGVENTTLNSKLVEDCMVLRLKSWKFPLPEGGVDVKVSYPFVLRRAGQG